jgi:tetratricopeptide (TPR) repeat protein
VARKRITGLGVGGPLGSASVSWEYADGPEAGPERDFLVLPGGRLPKVREISDPIVLGVHPSSPVDAGSRGPAGELLPERIPAYVPRDIDDELRRRLAMSGFVLIVGESTAGKSRAASEAITALLPDHILVVPQGRESVPAAVDKAASARRSVLWLDDLENFLGPGGLTRESVTRVLAGRKCHRVIVATLRAAEESLLLGGNLGCEESGWQPYRDERKVLEQAYRISLPRIFSRSERDKAKVRAFDPRIADALAHASVYGLAEYVAAGPELVRDWENAWSPNTESRAPSHPRGAALVAAAVEIRRAGYMSPLPRQVLESVHDHYLRERGGTLLRPESLAAAWEWATRPRRATTAMLQGSGDWHVQAFDYLLDAVQRQSAPRDHPPDSVMEVALAASTAADADSIGTVAHRRGRYSLAETASLKSYRTRVDELGPDHVDALAAGASHANALRQVGRYEESESEHRAIAGIAARVYGPEHHLTLGGRTGRAFALIRMLRSAEAEEELRTVRDIAARALGPDHDVTLTTRHLHAIALHQLGRLTESENENRAVLAAWIRALGPEDASALLSRGNLASVLEAMGRREEAEKEARAVLEIRTRISGPDHPDTLRSRQFHATILRRLGRNEECESEYRAVAEITTRIYGPEHEMTLDSRLGHAFALIGMRRLAEAEEELRTVRDIAAQALKPGHGLITTSRHIRAIALYHMGRLTESESESRAVLAIWSRDLGPDHVSTLRCRGNLAMVLDGMGRSEEAGEEARAVLDIRSRVFGPDHPDTARIRSLITPIDNDRDQTMRLRRPRPRGSLPS